MNSEEYCNNCVADSNCGYYSVWGDNQLILCTGITYNFSNVQYNIPVDRSVCSKKLNQYKIFILK